MDVSTHLPCATIKQWEDATVSLVATLKDYVDACLNITPKSLDEGVKPSNLATRIDTTLEVISDQFLKINCSLARVRNRVVPSFFRLPEEIISTILMHLVFDRRTTEPYRWGWHQFPRRGHLTVFQEVRLIYSRLSKVLRVCSSWRDILMTEGNFWSVIPLFPYLTGTKWPTIERSLQRAGGCKLYLAAGQDKGLKDYNISESLPGILTQYGPRFRAISLSVDNLHIIRDAVISLLLLASTRSLTELSIEFNKALDASPSLPKDSDYIFPPLSSQQALFTDMVGMLTTFRVGGIHFHWDTMVFSTRLVELQIGSITLGYDDAIIPFLHALSSASGLQDLKIISVTTFRPAGVTPNQDAFPNSSIEFPNLRSLHLQNLYFNTLELFLPLITPFWHCLTLFLTRRCLKVKMLEGNGLNNGQAQPSKLDRIANLVTLLKPLSLHALTIGEREESSGVWLDVLMFQALLKGLPTLKTLKLHNWLILGDTWSGLTRPHSVKSSPQAHSFAALENLYLSAIRIRTIPLDGFQRMVASHPLQRVVLEGVTESLPYKAPPPNNKYEKYSLGKDDRIARWLSENVPEFRLVDRQECLPEFYLDQWQLW